MHLLLDREWAETREWRMDVPVWGAWFFDNLFGYLVGGGELSRTREGSIAAIPGRFGRRLARIGKGWKALARISPLI